MNRLLFGILLLVIFSCNRQEGGNVLDKPFIQSYYKINAEGTNIITSILEPYEIENDSVKIDKVYSLKLLLDTTFYPKEELEHTYFIGVKTNTDKLVVFSIDFYLGGRICQCEIIEDRELIINNYEYLFTEISRLKDCEKLEIPDSLYQHTYNDKVRFRHIAWSSSLAGNWSFCDRNNKDSLSNIWAIKKNWDEMSLEINILDEKRDTVLSDSLIIDSGRLCFFNSGFALEIGTLTNDRLMVKEQDSTKYHTLKKENN